MKKSLLTIQDRFKGAMVGLAVGDALGAAIEFQAPGTFKPLDDMRAGGYHRLQIGQWTDDTSMALCLALSLIEQGRFDAADQMERYVRWWQEGYMSSTGSCFDIGRAVASALHRFMTTQAPFSGSTDPKSAGNGSLMRLAPIPLFYCYDALEAMERAEQSSRTTHGAQAAVDACRYFAGLMCGALNGVSKDTLLAPHFCPVPGYFEAKPLCAEIAEVAGGSFKHKQPPAIVGSGYVVESLEAALWAFYNSDNFRDGCLLAANLGHDADTTAAIYGQLAGTYYGIEAVPESWRTRLAQREFIEEAADQLFLLAWNQQHAHPRPPQSPDDEVLYLPIPADMATRRRMREIAEGRVEVVRIFRRALQHEDGKRFPHRAFLMGVANSFPPFEAPVAGRDLDPGFRLLDESGKAVPMTLENPLTREEYEHLDCLIDFAHLNRPFEWTNDPRKTRWEAWVDELDRGGPAEPVAGSAQELWDVMRAVARADRFNEGVFYEHAVAMTRLANEIRRRLLGDS